MVQVKAPAADLDAARLRAALDDRVDGEVRFDSGTLSAYAQDASNYRQVPIGVVVPRTVDAGAAAVAVCREAGAPVLSRGGGTSLAGQCVNDRGRHRLDQVLPPAGLVRRRRQDRHRAARRRA